MYVSELIIEIASVSRNPLPSPLIGCLAAANMLLPWNVGRSQAAQSDHLYDGAAGSSAAQPVQPGQYEQIDLPTANSAPSTATQHDHYSAPVAPHGYIADAPEDPQPMYSTLERQPALANQSSFVEGEGQSFDDDFRDNPYENDGGNAW